MIERGTIFTPDKKSLLINEVKDEINKLNQSLRNSLSDKTIDSLKDIYAKLQAYLKELNTMNGVVTPSKTDEILDGISLSKKTRLESEYVMGIQRSTLWLLFVIGISAGLYYNYKKRGK